MPSYELPVLKADLRLFSLTQPVVKAKAGIVPYGAGVSATVQARAGFKLAFDVQAKGGIATSTPVAPTNPVAAHIGSGTVIFNWTASSSPSVHHYEIWGSTSLGGTYERVQGIEFTGTRGVISNLPIGILLYFKIRAVGKNGVGSSFVQVKKGTIQRPTFPVEVRAIKGSIIKAGTVFAVVDQTSGRLIAISAVNDINITC